MTSLEIILFNRSSLRCQAAGCYAALLLPLLKSLELLAHVVSSFSNGGGLHLRISGLQIRKRYHNH